ncbi:MAG: methyltransferase domain-containing protein [Pseudomonadota bacterium]
MTEQPTSDHYMLGDTRKSHRRYQLFNEVHGPGTNERLAALALPSDCRVLEIGCGIGITACELAQTVARDGHVTGIDAAPEIIDLAREEAKARGVTNVTFECIRAQDFDYPQDQFDLAHSRFVLTYFSDAAAVIAQVYGALKPGGVFLGEELSDVFVSHNADWFHHVSDWLEALVEIGGGQRNYGRNQLVSDVMTAGFQEVEARVSMPTLNQPVLREMIAVAVRDEFAAPLIAHGVATQELIDGVVQKLLREDSTELVSGLGAFQVSGRKPE